MQAYSKELKQTMIQKMLTPGGQSINELAQKNGISTFTLYNWKRQCANSTVTMGKNKKKQSGGKWTKTKMLEALVATASMSEEETGTYLRKKGLLSSDLEQFKNELTQSEDPSLILKLRSDNRDLKQENKLQAREIRRKEKALAEASALLIFKKKAALIWGCAVRRTKSSGP